MTISDNSFGLFSEFTIWVDNVTVILKRPQRIVGEYKVPDDNDLIIVVDEDNEWKDSVMNDEGTDLTEGQKEEIVKFLRDEISKGNLKFPASLEYNTFDFGKTKDFELN